MINPILRVLKKVFITVLGRLIFSIVSGVVDAIDRGIDYFLKRKEEKKQKKEEQKASLERTKLYKEVLAGENRSKEDIKNATEEFLNSRNNSSSN